MKYIKKFENKNNNFFWIVMIEYYHNTGGDYQVLFRDKKSAENFMIVTANEYRNDTLLNGLKDDDMFLTISEVADWLNENDDINIYLTEIECYDNYELPKNYELIGSTRKYNI